YVADGVGEVFVSGRQLKLEPGEFVVVNAGVQHDLYAYGSVELRILSFFPAAVVESTFQDPVMPMGTNVLSSQLRAAVTRDTPADELPRALPPLAAPSA